MTCFDVRIFFHLTHFSWTFIGNVSRSLSFVSVQVLKLPFFSDRADSVQHSSASISKLHNFLIFVRPPAPALLGTIRSVARAPGTRRCTSHAWRTTRRSCGFSRGGGRSDRRRTAVRLLDNFLCSLAKILLLPRTEAVSQGYTRRLCCFRPQNRSCRAA